MYIYAVYKLHEWLNRHIAHTYCHISHTFCAQTHGHSYKETTTQRAVTYKYTHTHIHTIKRRKRLTYIRKYINGLNQTNSHHDAHKHTIKLVKTRKHAP
jgi:hypothetical protein